MTMWERRQPTLEELKPIAGQLSLDDLNSSNNRPKETHQTNSASEQVHSTTLEEITALGGLTEVISSQKQG